MQPSSTARDLDLRRPVSLVPVTVDKPWGREVWYSGVEARGESAVRQDGTTVPLSDYLRAMGRADVVLLKELHATGGDLYLEVHETKSEVYVARGPGRLQHGMNQALRRRHDDDAAFRQAFLRAARAYETGAAGREAVDAFVAERALDRGDVVAVEPWTPHSLQRGASVVEFQTPVFERLILASNRPVATQAYWDTGRALGRITLDPPAPAVPEPVGPGAERLAGARGFGVWRARGSVRLPAGVPYVVGLVLDGVASVDGGRVEGGFLAPAPVEVCARGEAVFAGPGL